MRSPSHPLAPRLGRTLLALAALSAAGKAQLPTPTALWTLDGVFGATVADAIDGGFDVDGDGAPDVVIGMPRNTPLGFVRVLRGSDGALIHQVSAPNASLTYGSSVALLGDLDGDGRSEFAIGFPTEPTNGLDSGAVTVHSGFDASLLFSLNGALGEQFGKRVVAVGDLDLDGVPDLMVFASAAAAGAGRIDVFSGATQAVIRTRSGTVAEPITQVMAGGGDVDGDGVPDVILAAGVVAGSHHFVLSGADFGIIHTVNKEFAGVGTTTGAVIVGDLDQDGSDEFAVCTYPSIFQSSEIARLYNGATGASMFTMSTPAGASVGFCAVGDVDGDFVRDIAALDVNWAFRVYSGVDGAALTTAVGVPQQYNFFGPLQIASAGDVDGDGFPELCIASTDLIPLNPTHIGNGTVRVYHLGYAGTPPRSHISGPACPGSAGNLALTALTGTPAIGQNVAIVLRNAPPFAPAMLNLGMPTFMPLGPYGATGCVLTAAADGFNVYLPADASGSSTSGPLLVPNDPAIVGIELGAQFVVVDPGANPANLVTSRGIDFVIGA